MKFKEGDILKRKDSDLLGSQCDVAHYPKKLKIKYINYSGYYVVKIAYEWIDSPTTDFNIFNTEIKKYSIWFVENYYELDIKEQRKNKLNKLNEQTK
jgi:hypothetical protein